MKRLFDILLALFGLVVLMPFFVIIAILIVMESRGGVFYLQERIGKNSEPFKLIKFRTMAVGSDKKGLLTVGDNDSRVTKVGYFLRKYKLDEFPQLINVLIGQMSMIGPRPEVKKYVDLYNVQQQRVLSIKPGITDYASIMYSSESEILAQSSNPEKTYIEEIMPHKLSLNLAYIDNKPSLLGDLKLIFQTLYKIIKK